MKSIFHFSFLLVIFLSISCNRSNDYKNINGSALGTTYSIVVDANFDQIELKKSIDSIFNVINNSMSTYIDNSVISKVNSSINSDEVDLHFKNVFNKSKEIWFKSKGYFDPTIGSLVNLYGLGSDINYEQINESKIDSIKKFIGFDKVKLQDDIIIKENSNIFLDFNAIAKGYSVDIIKEFFLEKGLQNFLIEVGGEISVNGHTKKNKKWKIAIQNPIDLNKFYSYINLENISLATSGNYRKFRIDPITGERYAHIVNPKTGLNSKNNILSVSVISSTCMEADAWATAVMSMDTQDALEIINNINDTEVLILTSQQSEITAFKSFGWDSITD